MHVLHSDAPVQTRRQAYNEQSSLLVTIGRYVTGITVEKK